ncbi:hypothetical protein [Ochrovirga pacifica]|uniref:hypothetical protein n=1 Tax=Ochrovirga pacifica TaxID=1042376 RepID=UPI000255878F|nr:hypothetical protein [Ochrovirga pacifica]
MYPTIYKLSNANEEGGYQEGIEPTYNVDEIEKLEVFALGDRRELLLAKALEIIKHK